MVTSNYFRPETAAERYARGRPFFHPVVIDRIRDDLQLSGKVATALDVGCGTGLSTRPLAGVAEMVLGVDDSMEMIAQAVPAERVSYAVAAAESLPVKEGHCRILTLCSVLHWLDREGFLSEARRALSPGGWMVIYDNGFLGQMSSNATFSAWMRSRYLDRFPSPQRDRRPFDTAEAQAAGFGLLESVRYGNEVSFSVQDLVDYLVTQTNVIAAVEGRGESLNEVRGWLLSEVEAYFSDATETFLFAGPISYLERLP